MSDDYRILTEEELDRDGLRNKFGIKNDYILSVGNLQPRKNLGRLIKAYRKLKKEGRINEQLVIVGGAGLYFDPFYVDDIEGKIIQMKDMVSDREAIARERLVA